MKQIFVCVHKERSCHNQISATFLAPIGAQGVTMFVRSFIRPSIRLFGSSLSRAVNIHYSGLNLQAISQE